MIAEFRGENHLSFKSLMANTGFCLDCEEDRFLDEQGRCEKCLSASTIPHGSLEGLKYNLRKKEEQ